MLTLLLLGPNEPPMKTAHLQAMKLILGFLSGVALLSLFAFHVMLGLQMSEAVQMLVLSSALGAFGIATHGAFRMQPGDKQ